MKKLVNGIEVEMSDEEAASVRAEWDAAANAPTPVPQEVTRRQAKQALALAGSLANIQPAIDAIADPTQRTLMQIEWDDSQVFQRSSPALLGLAALLGMKSAEIDQLFITAAAL